MIISMSPLSKSPSNIELNNLNLSQNSEDNEELSRFFPESMEIDFNSKIKDKNSNLTRRVFSPIFSNIKKIERPLPLEMNSPCNGWVYSPINKENISLSPSLPVPKKRIWENTERSTTPSFSTLNSSGYPGSTLTNSGSAGSPSPVKRPAKINQQCCPSVRKKAYNSTSEFTEKAKMVLENKYILKNDERFSLEILSSGHHSSAFAFQNDHPFFYENRSNDQLVLKAFHQENSGEYIGIKEQLENMKNQFNELSKEYTNLPEEIKPYAQIYNFESIETDGYIIQEKIKTFEEPLWDNNTTEEEINKNILDQIKELFVYSYKNHHLPGLDLKWANIGLRGDSEILVLFDYFELDDPFYLIYNIALGDIANGNEFVTKYIHDIIKEIPIMDSFTSMTYSSIHP